MNFVLLLINNPAQLDGYYVYFFKRHFKLLKTFAKHTTIMNGICYL